MTTELHPQARHLLNGPLHLANPNLVPELSRLRQANPVVDTELVGPGEQVFKTWDSTVAIYGRDVGLRWYQPAAEMPQLLTLFVHGGGWVNGSLASYDALCRSLALRTDGGVVSIGYTLSPEAQYPVALIEIEHVLCNVTHLPGSMVREGMRFAAAGDSAGANLLGAHCTG